MAEVLYVEPVVRFCAVISSCVDLREMAINELALRWGPATLAAKGLPFHAGGFYSESMGTGLIKDLVVFGDPIDPAGMPDWKLETNQLEQELVAHLAAQSDALSKPIPFDADRPLNLDPGYVTQAKLVLATTKDRDHRLYLRDGIFAEVTLTYTAKRWIHHRWTYPDYRTETVANFSTGCRNHLREYLLAGDGFRTRLK